MSNRGTRRTISRRRKKSTVRKDGTVIKYKYPNRWTVRRKIHLPGRDLRVSDTDLKRIDRLGDYDWERDPVTGKRVIDAYVEDPPRPDRDDHVYLPNKRLDAWEYLTKKLSGEDKYGLMELKRHMKRKGFETPGKDISYFKKRGWITVDPRGNIVLEKGLRPSRKLGKFLDKYDADAVIFNRRSVNKWDIQYMNTQVLEDDWGVTYLGNNIIYYDKTRGGETKWKREYAIFQMHDQGVASDSYKPVVMKKAGSLRGPTLAYHDLKGNGLLIKNLHVNLDEAKDEVESVKLGRYLGAGVPQDARVIKEHGDYYVIEKLIPSHKLWGESSMDHKKQAVKDTYRQAGRSLVFHNVTHLTDRHGYNIMITQRGQKYNLQDIDFGFVEWDYYGEDNPPQRSSNLSRRVPSARNIEGMKKYKAGRREAINRIVKLHHLKEDEETFSQPKRIKMVAQGRNKSSKPKQPPIPRREEIPSW